MKNSFSITLMISFFLLTGQLLNAQSYTVSICQGETIGVPAPPNPPDPGPMWGPAGPQGTSPFPPQPNQLHNCVSITLIGDNDDFWEASTNNEILVYPTETTIFTFQKIYTGWGCDDGPLFSVEVIVHEDCENEVVEPGENPIESNLPDATYTICQGESVEIGGPNLPNNPDQWVMNENGVLVPISCGPIVLSGDNEDLWESGPFGQILLYPTETTVFNFQYLVEGDSELCTNGAIMTIEVTVIEDCEPPVVEYPVVYNLTDLCIGESFTVEIPSPQGNCPSYTSSGEEHIVLLESSANIGANTENFTFIPLSSGTIVLEQIPTSPFGVTCDTGYEVIINIEVEDCGLVNETCGEPVTDTALFLENLEYSYTSPDIYEYDLTSVGLGFIYEVWEYCSAGPGGEVFDCTGAFLCYDYGDENDPEDCINILNGNNYYNFPSDFLYSACDEENQVPYEGDCQNGELAYAFWIPCEANGLVDQLMLDLPYTGEVLLATFPDEYFPTNIPALEEGDEVMVEFTANYDDNTCDFADGVAEIMCIEVIGEEIVDNGSGETGGGETGGGETGGGETGGGETGGGETGGGSGGGLIGPGGPGGGNTGGGSTDGGSGNCGNYEGTVFFEECGGVTFFFIELADGTILDPYYGSGVSFTEADGQYVNFDYVTSDALACPQADQAVTITCIEEGSAPVSGSTPFFSDYPFLSNTLNASDCDGTSIDVYTSGIYQFIHVKGPDGGTLYFQDGTLYCTDAANFNCVEAYGLINGTTEWTCGENNNNGEEEENNNNNNNNNADVFGDFNWLSGLVNANDCDGTTVNVYQSGIYSFISVETASETNMYFQDGSFYCADAPGFNCVAAYGLSTQTSTWTCGQTNSGSNEETGGTTNNVLNDFTWLSGVVNSNDCDGTTVMVYSTGTYDFISIESNSGTVLYFEDGTYYCGDAPGFNCVAAYGLTNVVDTWTCGATEEGSETETNEETAENPIFIDFSWLSLFADPCESGETFTAYDINGSSFVFVQANGSELLYYDDGVDAVLYCKSAGTLDCYEAYGLGNATVTHTWTCGEGTIDKNETERVVEIEEETKIQDFEMYPNPARDHVNIQLKGGETQDKMVTIYDLRGTALQQVEVPANSDQTTLSLDIADLPTGVYMVQLSSAFHSEVKRLVKN